MKFFIDTANTKEIKEAWELGVIDGVTTNPSLIAKEKKEPVKLLKEICEIVDGPVSAVYHNKGGIFSAGTACFRFKKGKRDACVPIYCVSHQNWRDKSCLNSVILL